MSHNRRTFFENNICIQNKNKHHCKWQRHFTQPTRVQLKLVCFRTFLLIQTRLLDQPMLVFIWFETIDIYWVWSGHHTVYITQTCFILFNTSHAQKKKRLWLNSCTVKTVTLGSVSNSYIYQCDGGKKKLNKINQQVQELVYWKYVSPSSAHIQQIEKKREKERKREEERERGREREREIEKERREKQCKPTAFTDLFAHKYYVKWHTARIYKFYGKLWEKCVDAIDER